MADTKTIPLKSPANDVSMKFELSAEFDYPYYPHLTVGDNARAQIDNEQSRNCAIEKHDLKWVHERDKLANSAVPFPDFDLGSRQHWSLDSEYQERRTEWEYGLAGIENKHDETKMFIREEGQTLDQEFAVRSGNTVTLEPKHEFQAVPQTGLDKSALKDDFSAQSSGKTEQDFAVSKDLTNSGRSL